MIGLMRCGKEEQQKKISHAIRLLSQPFNTWW